MGGLKRPGNKDKEQLMLPGTMQLFQESLCNLKLCLDMNSYVVKQCDTADDEVVWQST